jgi:SAM-dependent methyltransferase
MINPRLRATWKRLVAPRQPIELTAGPDDIDALFDVVERVWSAYGGVDPYWSVLTHPEYRGQPDAAVIESFYASGADEAGLVRDALARHGAAPGDLRVMLDFGCGLGRASSWFVRDFAEVIGVDLSTGHLEIAGRYMAEHGHANFRPLRLEGPATLERLPAFDALFSRLVLQHNPPPLTGFVIDRLLGRLAPGGFAILQAPTFQAQYRFRLARYLAAKDQVHEMELHPFPMWALFRIARARRCEVLEVMDTDDIGRPDWRSNTFVIRKSRADAAGNRPRYRPIDRCRLEAQALLTRLRGTGA